MAEEMSSGKPYVEVQVHSSDIRRGVRYLFVEHRQLRRLIAGGVAFGLFLLLNVIISPKVILDLLSDRSYRAELAERARLGEGLRHLSAELAVLNARSEDLRLEVGRIHLAYGLGSEAPRGVGGFPVPAEPVPESVYASAIRHANRLSAQALEGLHMVEILVDEIGDFERAHRDQVDTTPSLSPLSGEYVLTSPFGNRRSPFTKEIQFHSGLDLAAAVGHPIRAPADGTVIFAGRYPLKLSVPWRRFGNLVALANGDRFITLFGHCDEVFVRAGQRIKQGEVIAAVGSSGWSTSPHLHYEVRVRYEDGVFRPVDPRIYILDHRWADQERLLVEVRSAPDAQDYEPLPRLIGR